VSLRAFGLVSFRCRESISKSLCYNDLSLQLNATVEAAVRKRPSCFGCPLTEWLVGIEEVRQAARVGSTGRQLPLPHVQRVARELGERTVSYRKRKVSLTVSVDCATYMCSTLVCKMYGICCQEVTWRHQ